MQKLPTLNNRIKEIINVSSNGNVSDFASQIEVSQQRLSRIFAKDTRTKKVPTVPSEILVKINEMFVNIDPDWLLSGRGKMFRAQNTDKVKQLYPNYKGERDKHIPETCDELHKVIKEHKETIINLSKNIGSLEQKNKELKATIATYKKSTTIVSKS